MIQRLLFIMSIILILTCINLGKSITVDRILQNVSVSVENPFILIHISKTGGSTVRKFMHQNFFLDLEKRMNIPSIIPGRPGVPNYYKVRDFTRPHILNRTACSVGFLSHVGPKELSLMLFQIDLGFFGPVKCRRGWWDTRKVSEFIFSNPPIEESVFSIYSKMISGEKALKNLLFNSMVNVDVMQLSVDLILKSTCMANFREPINRMWSHFYFFDYKQKTNLSFVEYGNKYGDDLLWNLVLGNVQTRIVGDRRGLLRKTIFEHCKIGVRERFDLIINSMQSYLPLAPPYDPGYYASSLKEHSIEDVPEAMRKSLAALTRQDGLLWREAYLKIVQEEPLGIKGCSWCAQTWVDVKK